jgi:AcrR family transcriptional regulator
MVYKLNRRPSKKPDLLEAATQLVASQGFAALTIDALADAARVTKGGVQYHFESKDALIAELLEFLLSSFDQALDALSGKAWLNAYVDAVAGEASAGDRAVFAILAALPVNDPRTSAFDRYSAKWRSKALESGIDPALCHVIRLAADGLWLERGTDEHFAEDRIAIVQRLKSMIEENAA